MRRLIHAGIFVILLAHLVFMAVLVPKAWEEVQNLAHMEERK